MAYGKDTNDAKRDLSSAVANFVQTDSLDQAIANAKELAGQGDVVLFSPSCPVKGQYVNYAERGQAFVEAVNAL